ncbi:hypothetical protein [Burkholderia ubonensis]|uniref:C2H2-type domain-containing protein n=1 Tax=Burkholderia ubonensis TaxID=101571 RepID=A0ABD4E057_9BURK|nr:hypothetical protein [Burkholderia ubonensis]KVN83498.1 hypothetical protein WJ68_16435 [Burkholderia ubonensis]
MANGIEALSRVSDLSTDEVQAIAEQARANVRRLEACADHAFEPIGSESLLRQRYRCTHCSGELDAHAHRWYMRGREHEAKR